MDYATLVEQDFQRQILFNNVKVYHDAGYKGKGWTLLNAEENSDHMPMTNKVVADYAPEVTRLNGVIGGRSSGDTLLDVYIMIDGVKYPFEEAIDKFKIKVITRSFSGSSSSAMLAYFRDVQKRKGVIFFCSSGNETGEIGCWARDNTAITVSAVKLRETGEIVLAYSQSPGEVDFSTFMARGKGTSAASPALAAQAILLLDKYGDFNQEECIEIFKKYSKPLWDPIKFGYGLPILPLEDTITIGGKTMIFKDIEETRWSKEAIDACVEQGILVGFEDGTFRPTETVTREQLAVVVQRILNL